MARPKHSRSKRLVLDIGSSAIRLCELAQTKTGYQVTKYYQREFLAEPSMSEDDKKNLVCAALAKLLKDAKVRTRKTVFGVPGQSVFVRNRALPPVPEHKVTQIVRYEIQQQIPFGLDQIALDYQVLNRTEAGGYDVLMAAIKVEVVDKRIEIIKTAKCRVDVVDVSPMAAYNWIKHTGEFGAQGECVALLDLGASTTDIVIERENQFRFTRSLNLGGNDITSAIAAGFSMTFAEAEKLKRERGFAPTGDAKADGRGGEVIGQVLNRLITEINRSFAYFRSQPGGGAVSRVIVTGGGSCLRNIIPFLQRQLGVEVRIAQPLSGLAIAPAAQEASEHPEQACVALGLALRCIATVPIEINLIPPRIIESARRREQAFYWALSLVTLMLILTTIIPDEAQKNELKVKQTQLVINALQQYDPELITKPTSSAEAALKKAQDEIKGLQATVDVMERARNSRTFLLARFKSINDARPEGKGLWFSSVETTVISPDTTSPGGAMGAAAPRGGGTRSRHSDDDEDNFGGMPAGPQLSAGVPSTGFPGIQPILAGTRGATGPLGGGLMGPGAAMGGGMGADSTQESAPPPRPNGIRVKGYAIDPETVKAFVERLRELNDFKVHDPKDPPDKKTGDGVYFDEASMARRSTAVLANATEGPMMSGASSFGSGGRGMRSKRDDDDDGGSLMNGRSMPGSVGGGGASTGIVSANEANVTSFTVELQFDGNRVEPVASTGGGMMGAPIMGGAPTGMLNLKRSAR